jgi:hypothetical protein
MNCSLFIRQAVSREIDLLLKIWIEKVIYLKTINTPLWDTHQFSLASLKAMYLNSVFYAAFLGEEIVGGFILVEKDLRYWPEKDDDNSFYVHKLVVKNGHEKKGYAHVMLEWIRAYGKSMSKTCIRLDYDESRKYLAKLYLSHGFFLVARIVIPEGRHMIKAECIL